MKLVILCGLLMTNIMFATDFIIDQKDKTFIPHKIVAKVGDTITFRNSDPFAHNAYTDDENNEFDIGIQSPGSDITVNIRAAGDFNIECAIHPNMLLEVKVIK